MMNILTPTLAHQPSDSSRIKMALIAEGGGQRGIFTAGVLDAWLENDFDPFDLFIGTSAGSQNLTSFLSRQKGYAKQLIRILSCRKRFYKISRGLMGGNVVDLDWYFNKTVKGKFALDFSAAIRSLGQRELFITATNSRNRQGYFLRPNGNSKYWRELLKASSALPFLYQRGVKLAPMLRVSKEDQLQDRADYPEDDLYLDGGLAEPLPVRQAYRLGARKIVVIRTVNVDINAEIFAQSAWIDKLKLWIYVSGYCPKAIAYLVQHKQVYQQELDFIAKPPDDVEILQIFSNDKIQSKLLGSTDEDLLHDYYAGIFAGQTFLQTSQ